MPVEEDRYFFSYFNMPSLLESSRVNDAIEVIKLLKDKEPDRFSFLLGECIDTTALCLHPTLWRYLNTIGIIPIPPNLLASIASPHSFALDTIRYMHCERKVSLSQVDVRSLKAKRLRKDVLAYLKTVGIQIAE